MPDVEPKFRRHVRSAYEERIAELLEAAEAVQATMASPGWQVVMQLLDAESSAEMAKTGIELAEYARVHGYLAGLCAAKDAGATLVEHAEAELRKQRAASAGSAPAQGAGR